MSEIKVSIIIPVYNVEKYLRACLNSVVAQTLDHIEVIAVNDGSTDTSAEILKEYEEKYPELIKVFTITNHGVSYARNYGVNKAQGEYILFVDSDDLVSKNACEILYNKAKKDNNDIVRCRYVDLRKDPTTGKMVRTTSKAFTVAYTQNFSIAEYKHQLTHFSPYPWDKLYRRTLVMKHPFPEGMRFEDLAIMYPMICEAKSLGVVSDRLYHYRRESDGSFLSSLSDKTLDIVRALELMVEGIRKQNRLEELYEEVEFICIRHIFARVSPILDDEKLRIGDFSNRGDYELKAKIISECLDFLCEKFPNYKENRYLKYSGTGRMQRNAFEVGTKEDALAKLTWMEKTSEEELNAQFEREALEEEKRREKEQAKKKKHKLRDAFRKTPVYMLFSLPRSVRYTRFLNKYPVSEEKVLFVSKQGEDLAGNMFRMLYEMQEERFGKFEIYVSMTEDTEEKWKQKLEYYGMNHFKIVRYNSNEHLKLLATAKYLITDTSLQSFFVKRKEQIYLNTWHGTPLKAMGRRVPQREYALGNVQRNFAMADYLLYQNEFSRDVFLDDYMIRELYRGKVLLSGYPRNSSLCSKERYTAIREELELEDMQIFAYMPTWRGLLNNKENAQQKRMIMQYLKRIDAFLTDNQRLYVKLHPFVTSGLNYDSFRHIAAFPEKYETYDFLNATDALITDYSSIMFDYAVTGKKIVLFTYDREEYLKDRGMYLDIDKLGLLQANTILELKERLKQEMPPEYQEFRRAYCPYDNENTAKEVCDFLFLEKQPSFSVETVEHNGKKNVLVLISPIADDEATEERMKRFKKYPGQDYNYYFCLKSQNAKIATSKLAILPRDKFYMPLSYDVNYTIAGRLACIFAFRFNLYGSISDKMINKIAKVEKEKYFADFPFDVIINMTHSDRLFHHIIGQFEQTKIYDALSFKPRNYAKRGNYRNCFKYLDDHLALYDYVVGNKQLQELPGNDIKKGRVKLIRQAASKMDVKAVLDEVGGKIED